MVQKHNEIELCLYVPIQHHGVRQSRPNSSISFPHQAPHIGEYPPLFPSFILADMRSVICNFDNSYYQILPYLFRSSFLMMTSNQSRIDQSKLIKINHDPKR